MLERSQAKRPSLGAASVNPVPMMEVKPAAAVDCFPSGEVSQRGGCEGARQVVEGPVAGGDKGRGEESTLVGGFRPQAPLGGALGEAYGDAQTCPASPDCVQRRAVGRGAMARGG